MQVIIVCAYHMNNHSKSILQEGGVGFPLDAY